jgi:hypothetical protein
VSTRNGFQNRATLHPKVPQQKHSLTFEDLDVKRNLFLKTALALAIAAPLMASAESQVNITGGSAQASVDLQVIIPGVLYLAVGRGTEQLGSVSGTIDTVTFSYMNNAGDVGTGNPAANAFNSWDDATPSLPVRVFGNTGQVTISASNPADLVRNGGTETISFSQMLVESDNTNLPAPAFSGGTSQPLRVGGVTDHTARWTYTYVNTAAPAAGTYIGRVTYTASML